MPVTEAAATLAAKFFWPFLGAILALIVIPPASRTEAYRRGSVSIIGGFIGGAPLREWLAISDTSQNAGFSLAVAAFISWWVLGALPSLAKKFASKDD
jgi:hypothetical protein